MNHSLIFAKPEDDLFHRVESNDPAWIETVWFPFWITEQSMTGYIHLHVCPNRQAYRGSISIWRGDKEVHFLHRFEEPLPTLHEYGDLDRLNLPVGLSIACLKPLHTFRVCFDHPACRIDVTFDAMMTPVMMAPDDAPGMYHGHFNQSGRLVGTLELKGQRYGINCHTVRDRSWGPRQASREHRAGNCNGTSANSCFYLYVKADGDGDERIVNGHYLHHGQLARISFGRRTTQWQGNKPVAILLEAEDELGRRLQARGECLNLRATTSPPNLCVVLNLMKWNLPGDSLWGESHDVWSEEAWLAAGREPL